MAPDFVTLAHQHDGVRGFEAAVLDEFQRTVGFDAAFVLVGGQEAHLSASGLGAEAIEKLKLRAGTYGAELAPVKRVALAGRGVAVDTDVLGERAVYRSRYFRDVARSVSGRHGLLAYLRKGSQAYGLVMLGRSRGGFSRGEVETVEKCLPTLSLARASFAVPWTAGRIQPGVSRGGALFSSRVSELARVPLSEGDLVVRDRRGWREMVAGSSSAELVWTRVSVEDSARSGWPYADLFHLALARAPARRRVLVIGCGGGVSVRQLAQTYPGVQIDVVESEPVVAELARRFFGVGDVPQVRLHVADGHAFVKGAPSLSWDAVIVDAFDANSFVQGFADAKFLADARRVLNPGGAFGCNVIDSLTGGVALRRLLSAARKSFEDLRAIPVVELDETYSALDQRNIVVVGTRRR